MFPSGVCAVVYGGCDGFNPLLFVGQGDTSFPALFFLCFKSRPPATYWQASVILYFVYLPKLQVVLHLLQISYMLRPRYTTRRYVPVCIMVSEGSGVRKDADKSTPKSVVLNSAHICGSRLFRCDQAMRLWPYVIPVLGCC